MLQIETKIYVGILRAHCVEGQTVLQVDGAITIDCSRITTHDLLTCDVKRIEVVEVPRIICAIALDAESGKQPGRSGDSSTLGWLKLFSRSSNARLLILKPNCTVFLGRDCTSDRLKRALCSGSVDSVLTCLRL